jgi:hypothetical protein
MRTSLRLAAALSTAAAFGSAGTLALVGPSFSDVPASHWAADAITWAAQSGLMTGPSDRPGTFDPAGSVNRAQLAVVLSREHAAVDARLRLLEQRLAEMEHEHGAVSSSSRSTSSAISTSVSSAASSSTSSTWAATNSTWRDIDQAVIKLTEGKLYRSINEEKTWQEMKPMQWQSDAGIWYRFNADLELNSSADGVRWTGLNNRQWIAYGVTYWLDWENRVWKAE